MSKITILLKRFLVSAVLTIFLANVVFPELQYF
jgi:hypothetical protein